VSLSTVALGQGVAFFHAGAELLRSKSLDRNSYDSGDWFNRVFWNQQQNNFGVGLPKASDNATAWDIMRPILANEAIAPDRSDIRWTNDRFEELLEIRSSSRLFRLGSAGEIQARLSFANNGPDQVPGLIVMRLSDTVGADLDRRVRSMVIVINASDTSQTSTLGDTAGKRFRLHEVQEESGDRTVRGSRFNRSTGSFTVPAWTTAVFVEPQGDD
jgi:pullulanase/glycogen debranching enzyme